MKLCKDCKHYDEYRLDEVIDGITFQVLTVAVVTRCGVLYQDPIDGLEYESTPTKMRQSKCGYEGKFWEAK